MKESMENAKEELKRIDHLIYVTLKYTRTVDVFINIIERMVTCYEFLVDVLIKLAEKEKKINEKIDMPVAKANALLKIYDSKKIKENIEFYLQLRKLKRANYESTNEFRRHVTMTAVVDGKIININIDNITENFHMLKEFLEFVDKKTQI
ncbi:MAG: hypothetical protein QXM96_03040 [Candidatus Woesearchaeota archaeon]